MPILVMFFVASRFLVYNNRKKPYEKVNMALIDYYKIASVNWYLNIDKNEGKTETIYQYNMIKPTSEHSVEITSRELTLFYNGYIRQKKVEIFKQTKYDYYNFPEDIMDEVHSFDEFYHPKNSKVPYNALEDSKEISKINQLGQYRQLSISFDKDYSFEEAKELLKGQEGVIWLWVDKDPKENKAAEKIYEVKQSIKKDGPVKKEDIRILGCVIMCNKDNVLKLKNKSFIRGAHLEVFAL